MSTVIAATPRDVTNRRTVGDWVQIIRADLHQSVESIIAAGRHLQEAKRELPGNLDIRDAMTAAI